MRPRTSLRYVVIWSITTFVLSVRLLLAQPEAPVLQASQSYGSNLVVELGAQIGLFYTWQVSSDLLHWISKATLFAESSNLRWTSAVATAGAQGFVRAKVNEPNKTNKSEYHGWTNAVTLNNGLVEAVVVPAAGRVLQYRFVGETNGPFWENSHLYGGTATPTSWNTEGSFGGDKAWPSPQSDWGWPPPSGFDGSPYQILITNGIVTLIGGVDPAYQIRVSRVISLDFEQPLMRIRTVFQRTGATTSTNKSLGTWVITQLQEPVGCYVQTPSATIFTNGFYQLGTGMPANFTNANGLISFTRDAAAGQSHKLGFDADSLVWIGTNLGLRIDAPRVSGLTAASYPDGGCNTEVYTYPGTNAAYVELECLGPLYRLAVGEQKEFVTTYRLFRRIEDDPAAEARRILAAQE